MENIREAVEDGIDINKLFYNTYRTMYFEEEPKSDFITWLKTRVENHEIRTKVHGVYMVTNEKNGVKNVV